MAENVNEDGWIRPMGKFESHLEFFHQQGFMVSSYSLTLNSKSPLEENHLKKSLLYLLRKVPSLSFCIRAKIENELWFHKMETEKIDFKVLENVNDVHKEFEDLSRHHYNSFDGPLFCARLIPQPVDASCAMPEIKLQYPHQYILLLGFHHAMTDGSSNIKICNAFLNLLNSVIAGEPINDLEKIGYHVSTEKTENLINEISPELISNPEELKRYQEILFGGMDDMLFFEAFPSPKNEIQQTCSLSSSLTKEETSCFLKRCKQEGVTIHTGYCSAINAALAEMLLKSGIKQETFNIKGYHTINTRRYWDGDNSNALGAHLGLCSLVSEASSRLDVEDFWKRAKSYHSAFNNLLEDKVPLKEVATMFLSAAQMLNQNKTEGEPDLRPFYYGTTNMGNMTSTFSGEGDHVQVTDFMRTTSTISNLCSHVMQTFRGRFIYSIDYDRQLMSKETAQLYLETIYSVLRKVINITE